MQLMSEQIDQLATALAKAQGEMMTAGKNQKNPFFKSSYADFEAIINASRPALAKHGLSVVQPPMMQQDGESYLVTLLMHCSGQWIQSTAKHNPPKTDVQSLSSYNTYLKRMCYTSLVGVAVGEDDDGESVMDRTSGQSNSSYNQGYQYPRQTNQPLVELITEGELVYLRALGKETQVGILEKYNVESLKDLSRKQFAVIEERIETNKKKLQEKELQGN